MGGELLRNKLSGNEQRSIRHLDAPFKPSKKYLF